MRAVVTKDRGKEFLPWTVDLWVTGRTGVPFWFGQRTFPLWREAHQWALYRVHLARSPHVG